MDQVSEFEFANEYSGVLFRRQRQRQQLKPLVLTAIPRAFQKVVKLALS